jgi:hypothetical protein
LNYKVNKGKGYGDAVLNPHSLELQNLAKNIPHGAAGMHWVYIFLSASMLFMALTTWM